MEKEILMISRAISQLEFRMLMSSTSLLAIFFSKKEGRIVEGSERAN